MSYARLLSYDKQQRVLERLRSLPIHLLADCVFDQDFYCSTVQAGNISTGGRVVRYVPSAASCRSKGIRSLTEFRPVVVGYVKRVLSMGPVGGVVVHLGFPSDPGHLMDVALFNQLACLRSVAATDSGKIQDPSMFEDILPCTAAVTGVDPAYSPTVIVEIPLDAAASAVSCPSLSALTSLQIRHALPSKTFSWVGLQAAGAASPSSVASSSTLSSTSDACIPSQERDPIAEGDLVAVYCALRSTDYPRSDDASADPFIRVYGLDALAVDVVV
ncbi:hypothetical protein DFH09DRAFT_1483270 [Mycena vulgaris]|nr:hypothetical protein DFH09DRAFT_1483270 [Mycena vulgaris]